MQARNLPHEHQPHSKSPAGIPDGQFSFGFKQMRYHFGRKPLSGIAHLYRNNPVQTLHRQRDGTAFGGIGQRIGNQIVYRTFHKDGVQPNTAGCAETVILEFQSRRGQQWRYLLGQSVEKRPRVRGSAAGGHLMAQGPSAVIELSAKAQELIHRLIQLRSRFFRLRFPGGHLKQYLRRGKQAVQGLAQLCGCGAHTVGRVAVRMTVLLCHKQDALLQSAGGNDIIYPAQRQRKTHNVLARPQIQHISFQQRRNLRSIRDHRGCRAVAPHDFAVLRKKNRLHDQLQELTCLFIHLLPPHA